MATSAELSVIDLCCGKGGWALGFLAEGWRVEGYDIVYQRDYPGFFHRRDVRHLNGSKFHKASLIVASPPCEEFSRHRMPWTKRRKPPKPDLSVVEACWRIANEAERPMILENVCAAQRWLGRAEIHVGPFYLWGAVPLMIPSRFRVQRKERLSTAQERAMIPLDLARHVARAFSNLLLGRHD